MQHAFLTQVKFRVFPLSVASLAFLAFAWNAGANDYLLTIGGGYEPAGNQASLEANVLFIQQIVGQEFQGVAKHLVYFADGLDPGEDLQIVSPKNEIDSPAIALLESAFAMDRPYLTYRNHRVPDVCGPLLPKSIQSGLEEIAGQLTSADRLIIYVTAHGSAGPAKDPMNTSISCWRKEPLSMKKFTEWLDRLPPGVPVVMVMAQCYCGGFANAMFAGGDPKNGLSKAVRAGFFAQRFDLPAAGCRPDIENDEEYSSYFWGAFLGRSRTGKAALGVDCDNNHRVSFDEAHAYAVRASQTIDIPLRSSDLFLRYYSRIAGYESTRMGEPPPGNDKSDSELELEYFSGQLRALCSRGSKSQALTIQTIAQQLGLSLDCDVTEVFQQNEAQSELFRQLRFVPGRRGPGAPGPSRPGRRGPRNSSRREFQRELVESWPDLEKPSQWSGLPWLFGTDGQAIVDEFRQLPSFEAFQKSQDDRKLAREKASDAELREVQFRRLVHTMESVMLAQNLPRIASQEILARYHAMTALEASHLSQKK